MVVIVLVAMVLLMMMIVVLLFMLMLMRVAKLVAMMMVFVSMAVPLLVLVAVIVLVFMLVVMAVAVSMAVMVVVLPDRCSDSVIVPCSIVAVISEGREKIEPIALEDGVLAIAIGVQLLLAVDAHALRARGARGCRHCVVGGHRSLFIINALIIIIITHHAYGRIARL